MKNKIKQFVKNNSYFEHDYDEDGVVAFNTREHGDVGEEEPSPIDFKNAQTLKKKIIEKFPEVERVEVDTCDEWVDLVVILKEE